MNFLIDAAPTNLDPRIGADAYSAHVDGLMFSSLVARDAHLNVIPDLAQSWDIPDPLTYVFHLRLGVKFHDGRPLTSADVKYTFDTIIFGALKTPKRGAFKMVKSVEAPDDSTVIFHLSEPYASLLYSMVSPEIGIVPRGSGAEMAEHPIGTGPFRFVSATTDEEIVLERNENYFGGAPKIERLRMRIVPDAIVRALELRKGSADAVINSLTPDMVVTLAKDRGLAAVQEPGTTMAYLAFNFEIRFWRSARCDRRWLMRRTGRRLLNICCVGRRGRHRACCRQIIGHLMGTCSTTILIRGWRKRCWMRRVIRGGRMGCG